jgi:hypothetical protein
MRALKLPFITFCQAQELKIVSHVDFEKSQKKKKLNSNGNLLPKLSDKLMQLVNVN